MAITLVILIIYVILIQIFFKPEKSLLWIKRRIYKKESQITENSIRYTKMTSLISIFVITSIIIIIIFITKVEIGSIQDKIN